MATHPQVAVDGASAPTAGHEPSTNHPTPNNSALTHRQIMVLFSGLMVGLFLAALDQTIVAAAIRTIADDLNGLSLQAWATTAYLITATITTPLYGKLSDLFGRRPLFLASIVLFIGGSLACALVGSMYQLAAARALQGMGAGGLFALVFAIVGDVTAPRERAKYQGYFLAVFGIASVLGPVVGGYFAGHAELLGVTGWRWVFGINVPLGIIALAVVAKVMHVPHTKREHRIDFFGAAALTVCLVPLLIVAEQGREWGWDSPSAKICYGIGIAGLIAFIIAEWLIKEDALIPLRLFKNSVFSVSMLSNIIVGLGMFGGFAALPQYLQIVKGTTPTESGLWLLPLTAGIMVGSIVSGQITAKSGRYKIFPILGSALMAVSLWLLSLLGVDTPLWHTASYMMLLGVGLGACLQTLVMAAQNAVNARDMGVATASATFFRGLGGTLGTAIFLSILFGSVGEKIRDAFSRAAGTEDFQQAAADDSVRSEPANKAILSGTDSRSGNVGGVLDDSSFLGSIDERLARPILIGFSEAMHNVFIVGAWVMVAGCLISFLLKEIPLSNQSGLQALAAEGAVGDVPVSIAHRASKVDSRAVTPVIPTILGEVRGRVPIRGVVRARDGSAVANATVTLVDTEGHQIGKDVTSGEGRYSVHAPTHCGYVLIVATVSRQPQAHNLLVYADPLVVDIELSGTSELYGTVASMGAGRPVSGATVTLLDEHGELVASQATNSSGGYAFGELAAASYTVAVTATHFQPSAATIVVTYAGDNQHDVELAGAITLNGTARAETGRPVPDAMVKLLDPFGEVVAVTQTDSDGQYRIGGLTEGNYTVIVRGYPPATSDVALAGGAGAHDVQLSYAMR